MPERKNFTLEKAEYKRMPIKHFFIVSRIQKKFILKVMTTVLLLTLYIVLVFCI